MILFLDVQNVEMYTHTEKQRYDGWYNNLGHPEWGSVGKQSVLNLIYSNFIYIKLD